ncbi:hypothetical protein [Agarivorans sp. QJM3NY_25]|uniref:hypothetical protein n=1 Tax=Agarivorans sp. QJM3NY_25 TaxID=3421430 RepID=UPI003D7EB8C0
MRRFEEQFELRGVERIDWDGLGFRVLSYATVILFKTDRLNDDNYQFVPVSETRKLATKKDWFLALWLWGSGIGMLVVGFTYAFFFMA